jgi:hypothetical protein
MNAAAPAANKVRTSSPRRALCIAAYPAMTAPATEPTRAAVIPSTMAISGSICAWCREGSRNATTRLIRARASPTAEYAGAGRGLSEPEVGEGGG